MKKVGIITFHHAKHSYGAFLQAYATIRSIEKLGYEAEIINYENKYEQSEIKKSIGLKTKVWHFANWALRMFVFGGLKDPCRSKHNLDLFYKNVSKRYPTVSELDTAAYDILLAGSDQIWSPDVCDGLDPAFFLDFGKADRRVSYASSVGSCKFTEMELEQISKYLSRFSAISVRELYAAELLEKTCGRDIKVVCDPTLLLSGDQWRAEFKSEFDRFRKKERYILTYFVGGNINDYWERISGYVKLLKLPVYNVQSHSKKYPNVSRSVYNIMPGDLLAYIDNADLVLTDSFHGTAFSINLGKNFVAVINKKNPVRVLNLLDSLELNDRTDDEIQDVRSDIDYSSVDRRLSLIREDSYKWLSNALNDK